MTVTKDSQADQAAVHLSGVGCLVIGGPVELAAARRKVARILAGNRSLEAGQLLAELLVNCPPDDDAQLRAALDEALLAYRADHPLRIAARSWYRLVRARQRAAAGYDDPEASAWTDVDGTVRWGELE